MQQQSSETKTNEVTSPRESRFRKDVDETTLVSRWNTADTQKLPETKTTTTSTAVLTNMSGFSPPWPLPGAPSNQPSPPPAPPVSYSSSTRTTTDATAASADATSNMSNPSLRVPPPPPQQPQLTSNGGALASGNSGSISGLGNSTPAASLMASLIGPGFSSAPQLPPPPPPFCSGSDWEGTDTKTGSVPSSPATTLSPKKERGGRTKNRTLGRTRSKSTGAVREEKGKKPLKYAAAFQKLGNTADTSTFVDFLVQGTVSAALMEKSTSAGEVSTAKPIFSPFE